MDAPAPSSAPNVPVPGIDVSLPPLCEATLSALDGDSVVKTEHVPAVIAAPASSALATSPEGPSAFALAIAPFKCSSSSVGTVKREKGLSTPTPSSASSAFAKAMAPFVLFPNCSSKRTTAMPPSAGLSEEPAVASPVKKRCRVSDVPQQTNSVCAPVPAVDPSLGSILGKSAIPLDSAAASERAPSFVPGRSPAPPASAPIQVCTESPSLATKPYTKTCATMGSAKPSEEDVGGSSSKPTKKRRRNFSYWTPDEINLLLKATGMVGADFERVSKIVGTRSPDNCRKQIRAIATRIRGRPAEGEISRQVDCVRVVLRHLGIIAPPTSHIRRSCQVPRAAHKVAVQAVPANDSVDGAAIRALGRNPCVEIVLRASRSLWDVLEHLYNKWGQALQLVDPNGEVLGVGDTVGRVQMRHGTDTNVVRLRYQFINFTVDEVIMPNPGGAFSPARAAREARLIAGASGSRRISAPPPRSAMMPTRELPASENNSPMPSQAPTSVPDFFSTGTEFPHLADPPCMPEEPSSSSSTTADDLDEAGQGIMHKWKARLVALEENASSQESSPCNTTLEQATAEAKSFFAEVDADQLHEDSKDFGRLLAGLPDDHKVEVFAQESDNALDPHVLNEAEDSGNALPPIAGDPSINFSALFAEPMCSVGKIESLPAAPAT